MFIRSIVALCSIPLWLICLCSLAWAVDRAGEPRTPPSVPLVHSSTNLAESGSLAKKVGPGELGGDDVLVGPAGIFDYTRLAVASNGDAYLGVQRKPGFSATDHFEIYRSTDTGDHWTVVGTFDPAGDDYVRLRSVDVFEGAQDRVFVTYERYEQAALGTFSVRVAWADLTSGDLIWNVRTVMGESGLGFWEPDICSDAVSFSSYYIYAVARCQDGDGDDIWFSRSLDYGETWSAPYPVTSLSASPFLAFAEPRISFGQGNYLHVAYTYTERVQDTFDDGVRALRATNFGNSAGDWAPGSWILYSNSDGYDQTTLDIVANPTGPSVSVFVDDAAPGNVSRVYSSVDNGASWSSSNENALPIFEAVAVVPNYSNGKIVAFGSHEVAEADFDDTGTWENLRSCMETPGLVTASRAVAVDPTRSDGIALSWIASDGGSGRATWFDAEWRGGPGYPNYEPGFPLPILPSSTGDTKLRTAPAVADVDDDEFDEILFASTDGRVHVYNHDGTLVPGWPVNLGAIPWRAPVAVGDLNGDGQNVIVVGTTNGFVYCFDGDANPMPGFPVDLGTGADTYVSIGAVGPPYPRWIVATSGNRLARINYRGLVEFKSGTLNGTHMSPAAIGDVDFDGDAEIVYHAAATSGGSIVHVLNGSLQGGVQEVRFLPEDPEGAVTLGDIDLDGDLEICHPTATGILYVMHDDMSDLAGFPFDGGFSQPITSVGIDQIFASSEPDLFFTSLDGVVHLVLYDGVEAPAFPTVMSWLWYAYGAPISTAVAPGARYVVTSSRDTGIYAFSNIYGTNPAGWPRGMDDPIEVSAAAGDIDDDGFNEIVFVGNERLHVIDVGYPPNQFNPASWEMYGADPARTGCSDCAEDVATPAPAAGPTQLSFRQVSANPSSGPVSFAATLPSQGILSLEVFDLRGRRVRLVTRREASAGTHEISFDLKDGRGARIAHGVYLARMSVRTTGRVQTMTRKFALVDR